jgi:hypothetical protein
MNELEKIQKTDVIQSRAEGLVARSGQISFEGGQKLYEIEREITSNNNSKRTEVMREKVAEIKREMEEVTTQGGQK